ncbi:MAG: flippase-like domain-containing protein, partial [Bifidobacteriaceae bacterium]|nr:flippase-like domain-containing protein [Bifidobacteriaceae bacterium]
GRPPQAVAFDLDGLLVDSSPAWEASFRVTAARLGCDLANDQIDALMGLAVPTAAARIARWSGSGARTRQAVAILDGALAAAVAAEPPPLLPGAFDLVTALSGRVPLALASNGPAPVVAVALATGDTGVLPNLPVTGIVAVVGLVALLGSLLLIPRLRNWVWGRIGPTLAQVWPRLVWVLGRPSRMVFAMLGTIIQFGGYVAAFWAALVSFGLTDLPLGAITLVFLIGNAAGSAAPTPGGLGGVEIALTAGLRALGVATATAASAAVLFRAITYWARVPLGWIAFRQLVKHQDL